MPRRHRNATGGVVYHVLNRANGRSTLFESRGDYAAFLGVVAEAHESVPMRTLAFAVMPNHWHMVLWPEEDRDLSRFMQWLETTHTQRWHAAHGTTGSGHIYQGRFKSFPVQDNHHYLTVVRYVEGNPLRARLVASAEEWPWSSLCQRPRGVRDGCPPVVAGPLDLPENWLTVVNTGQPETEVQSIRNCIGRGRPLGGPQWTRQIARRLNIESSLRPRGRPARS